jgi:Flp pilus assembly protein TadG
MGALFFLAFAFFAVGQAAVTRNSAQTAADSAALAAARERRDEVKADFLTALTAGDPDALGRLLSTVGTADRSKPCTGASTYAADNDAVVTRCDVLTDAVGYVVDVTTRGTVGTSVVDGTENRHATATATAVVEPRCAFHANRAARVQFICDHREVTIDPTAGTFRLDLATFYTVHLTQ